MAIDLTTKMQVPNFRLPPEVYQLLAQAVQQKNQQFSGLGQAMGQAGGLGVGAYQQYQKRQQMQNDPTMPDELKQFGKYFPGQEGQLYGEILKSQKPTKEWAPVPGVISKNNKPLFYNPMTHETVEGDQEVTPTGFGSTMAPIRKDQLLESLVKDARETLNPYFQKGPAKEQAQRLDSISRIEPLISQMMSQPGGGDSRQMREAATAFNKVLQGGGVGAEGQIDALVPQTARGKLGGWMEWFTNDPQGLQQQSFIKRYADSVAREKTAIQQRVEFQAQKNAPTLRILKRLDPDSYQAVMDSVMGQFRQEQPAVNNPQADPLGIRQ